MRKGLQRRVKRVVQVEVTLTITEMFEEFILVKSDVVGAALATFC